MKLILIKDEVCPTCKSKVVAESCRNVHCNGQGFEIRTFECGCELSWCPNFGFNGRLETKRACPKSAAEVEQKKKRSEAKVKLLQFIQELDVNDEMKAALKQSVQSHMYNY